MQVLGVVAVLRVDTEAEEEEECVPGHLALLERVFLVLDGAAPSLSQLCGVVS